MRQVFFCQCGNELIVLDSEPDYSEVYVSVYQWTHREGIRGRLRLIWQAIRGRLYADQVILSFEDAEKLGNELLARTEEG